MSQHQLNIILTGQLVRYQYLKCSRDQQKQQTYINPFNSSICKGMKFDTKKLCQQLILYRNRHNKGEKTTRLQSDNI
jgi:hypothetical protein